MLHTHKPMTDEAIKAMRDRTAARAAICKRVLGAKYICHPSQQVQRKMKTKIQFCTASIDRLNEDDFYNRRFAFFGDVMPEQRTPHG